MRLVHICNLNATIFVGWAIGIATWLAIKIGRFEANFVVEARNFNDKGYTFNYTCKLLTDGRLVVTAGLVKVISVYSRAVHDQKRRDAGLDIA